jgi:flavin-dependent thymidylate synthase
MHPGLFEELLSWTTEDLEKELRYMAHTIPSSWEFCHYTFMIEGVTRAFTHQLVRTRTASFAQQTMRVLNVEGWKFAEGPSLQENAVLGERYRDTMATVSRAYDELIRNGAAIEDARGILPTNILTNIVMGANLRTMVEMIRKRSSPRTQGEYKEVLDAMKAEMLRVHPWVRLFIDRTADAAAMELYEEIKLVDGDRAINMIKLLDQVRQNQ